MYKSLIVLAFCICAGCSATAQIAEFESMPARFPFDLRGDKIFVVTDQAVVVKRDTTFQYVEIYFDNDMKSYTIEARELMSRAEIKTLLAEVRGRAKAIEDRVGTQVRGIKALEAKVDSLE